MTFSWRQLQQHLPTIRQLLPFLNWIGELRDRRVLHDDVVAGVTVALVLIPQSMAYAQLAGLEPYYGLYAAFLPGIIAALFGSSRQLATGPVAVVSLMTAAALEPLVSDPTTYVAYATLLALLVGLFQISLGLFRLGVLVNFLSHPVVVGFTNAAAIIIGTSQLDKLFGVSVEKSAQHYQTVWDTVLVASTQAHLPTVLMGTAALLSMLLVQRFAPRAPAVLIAVVLTTLAAWLADFEAYGGRVVGQIPQGLPHFQAPEWDLSLLLQLMGTAMVISVVGFMEAISVAKAMAARTRQKLDPNQELIGQGLGNLVGSLFQGYAVSGSFSRSAVNIHAGAVTGFSAVVTGAVVGATLMYLTPLLYHLPQATLAAVIIMAVVKLVRFKPILAAWRIQRHDGIVGIIVFVLTLAMAPHLEWGIVTGVVLSLGFFVYRTMRPRVSVLSRHPDGTLRDANKFGLQTCDSISLITFEGRLYFANTSYFEETVLERAASKPYLKYIILDAEGINEIDATGEERLHEVARQLKAVGIQLIVARANDRLMDVLEQSGFVDLLGREYFTILRTYAFELAWREMGCDAEHCPLLHSTPLMEDCQTVHCPVAEQAASNSGKSNKN